MDPAQALVVMDALLESGEAAWPGVGRFVLVLKEPRNRRAPTDGVYDFPTREVEFHAAPGAEEQVRLAGNRVELEGFGTFVLRKSLVFHSAPGLRARLIKTPAARFAARP